MNIQDYTKNEKSLTNTIRDIFIIHSKNLSIHFSIKVGNNLCSTQDYINTILELKTFSRSDLEDYYYFFFFGNRIQKQIIITTHSSIQKYICETILTVWFSNLKFCVYTIHSSYFWEIIDGIYLFLMGSVERENPREKNYVH